MINSLHLLSGHKTVDRDNIIRIPLTLWQLSLVFYLYFCGLMFVNDKGLVLQIGTMLTYYIIQALRVGIAICRLLVCCLPECHLVGLLISFYNWWVTFWEFALPNCVTDVCDMQPHGKIHHFTSQHTMCAMHENAWRIRHQNGNTQDSHIFRILWQSWSRRQYMFLTTKFIRKDLSNQVESI